MAMNKSQQRGSRSACDRCYQLKERCERNSFAASCERCARLNQACLTVRPVRPTGRQKKSQRHPASRPLSKQSTSGTGSSCLAASWLQDASGLSFEEKQLMTFLLDNPQSMDIFVTSSRFRAAEQESFARPLPAAWPILKDAYLAYAGVLKSRHTGNASKAVVQSHVRHATSALVVLQGLPVTNAEDAELCLTLGFAVALSIYAVIGAGHSEICRYCIDITKPYVDAFQHAETDSQLSLLVLLEIMDCIVHRRKPTLRIQPRLPTNMDHHLGLCLPLLPYYYDICDVSYSLLKITDVQQLSYLQQQLEMIRADVAKWQPSFPDNFLHDYSTPEVVRLLAQAKVYRLAALLIIHRLRYPFGEEDSQADIWSQEVMRELETARQISNYPVGFVTVPFLVAAVESRDVIEREHVLRSVEHHVDRFTPVVQKAAKVFLSRVWHERDTHTVCSWFNSIHKPCVILDAIGGTCSS